jgi:hypothetical protein
MSIMARRQVSMLGLARLLEMFGEDFHIAVWRMGSNKLGLQLAVFNNIMFINDISGSQIKEHNRRCCTCRVKQILEQQLLKKDRVVSVNGKTGVAEMLAELYNVSVDCCHMRVRRYPQEACFPNQHTAPLAVAVVADVAAATVSSEPRIITPLPKEHQHDQRAYSSCPSASQGFLQFPCARVIDAYDSLHEPERGYLTVVKGTIVAVQPGSRAPPDALNQFDTNYVYVWTLDQSQTKGWVPEHILDIPGQ